MAKINLPTAPRPAVLKTPKRMILFSKPKIGKTITISKLPKCLILDFEDGTLAIDAMSHPVKSYQDVIDVCDAITEAGYPYKFIAIDTASALEEMCIEEAELRYARANKDWFILNADKSDYHSTAGKKIYGSIMNLPFGKGYQYITEVYTEIINKIESCAPKIIILAHSTYSTVNKDGVEFSSLDIQMSKKNRFVSTFKADAIGYMYRKDKKNYINFTATDDIIAGGRHRYLEKEHILISEYKEDAEGNDELVTHWDKIFSAKNNK